MRRNWYAAGLLVLLFAAVWGAGVHVRTTTAQLDGQLAAAYSYAERGDYPKARQAYRQTAQAARQAGRLWLLLIRRSLIDQLNQTLATLPHYATEENRSDLAVETARAREQARQIRQSFFGRL